MTSTVITDGMVETFGNSLRKLAGLEPASYADMLETTPKVVEHIRLHLEAVAPMILEEAAKVPSEAASICLADAAKASEAGRDSCADRDRQAAHILRGIAADIRALRGGE
jgi:hypothetical protein